MGYKDKDKQREYQRQWVRQKRGSGSTDKVRHTQGSTGITFRPDCVTCDEMVEGDNGHAACDVGGCDKPVGLNDE